MISTNTFVTFAVATVDVEPNQHGTHSAISHLAAIALLIADRDADGSLTFSLKSYSVAAGSGEDPLLLWALNILPPTGIAIGWQLADRVMVPLLDAATVGDPEIGRAFLDRLMGLVTAPSVDLAVQHGGTGAPPFSDVAARHGICVPAFDPAEIESAWSFGDLARLRDHVAAEAIAAWRLFLAESNGTAVEASTAFDAWMADRDRASSEARG